MPVRKIIPEKDGVYFITFTCARWLPQFKITNEYNAVYKWFDVLKKSGHYVIGYTIMPGHVHAIIAFHNTGKTMNSIVAHQTSILKVQCSTCTIQSLFIDCLSQRLKIYQLLVAKGHVQNQSMSLNIFSAR